MTHDFQIISILLRRLKAGFTLSDLTDALRECLPFIAIDAQWPDDPYGRQFMALALHYAVRLQAGLVAEDPDYDLVLDLLDGRFEDPAQALAHIRSDLELSGIYQEIAHECMPDLVDVADVHVVLAKDGQAVLELPVADAGADRFLANVEPGHFCLCLDNGRRLWQHDLEARHLLERLAFPGKPLHLAASAGPVSRVSRRSLRASVLGGRVSMTVFPGLLAGRLQLTVAPSTGGSGHGN